MSSRVVIRPPGPKDEAEYVAAVRRSRKLHRPWVSPTATGKAFRTALLRWRSPSEMALFIFLRGTDSMVGVVTLSEIVRGHFQSAYLSYFAFEPHARHGLMREGLGLVITHAFGDLGLHRLEANIQPGNEASRRLVRALGFRQEGYSPRYLKISGRWKDHERWAILAEEWKSR
ncbi:MAG TPA: GNAT family protein [Candidatus Limnocylindrales bacterium]|nr:GNAT family protein [Candidatus Limnocylindrales bacterium]